MGFDFDKYTLMIANEKDYEEYRKKYIPQKIYKYISFDKNENSLNEEKIKTLEANKCWLSTRNNLNDPFELKVIIDEEKLREHGFKEGCWNWIDEILNEKYLIGSFTTNATNNMPMWAHYANNHRGICIEYEITNKKFFFPVIYKNKREDETAFYGNFLMLAKKVSNGEELSNEDNIRFVMCNAMILHNAFSKHKFWSYENEIRLFYPTKYLENIDMIFEHGGTSVSIEDLGIKMTGIYIGINCEIKRDYLIKMSKSKNLKIYKMMFNNKSPEYKLEFFEI